MVETLRIKPWEDPKFKNRLYRFGGYFGLNDYDPGSSIRSRRATGELGKGLSYPFGRYAIDRAFVNLAARIQPNFSNYNTVLSDDVSAHLVSTVFWNLINHARGAVDRTPAQIFYLAAGQTSKAYPTIEEYLSRQSSDLGKVLLVTEYAEKGSVLDRLSTILDNINADYDIAILLDGTCGSFSKHKQGHIYNNVYSGGVWVSKTRPPTDFMNDPAINGVYRDPDQTDPFSKEYRDDLKTTRRVQEETEIFTERLRITLGV